MSRRQLSRRLDRVPSVTFVLRSRMMSDYLTWCAAAHGVDVGELQAETEAMLRTWRLRSGNRLPAFEEVLAAEAEATGQTVAAVKAELLADIAAWVRSRQ